MKSPSRQRSLLLVCSASAISATVGFAIGRVGSPVGQTAGNAAAPSAAAREFSRSTEPADAAPALATAPRRPAELAGLLRTISSPAAEADASASLWALALTDPSRALELAQSASTPRQRDEFIRAVLAGWATKDPVAAARWTLDHVRLGERRLAAEALLESAIASPEAAMEAARFLCASDPLLQSDHGNALVAAFARAGRFDLATQFATASPGDFRAHWLCTAFSRWAQYQPDAAIAAAGEIAEPAARGEALQGLIVGWAMSDPAALVAHAGKFPAGETRTTALREGLQQWVSLDPVAASAWMDRLDPNPDLDAGAAAVATTPVIVEKKPEVATSWAESIVDPELRANTLLDLIRLWSERDPAAARSYAANSPALRPETRAVALASFENRTGP